MSVQITYECNGCGVFRSYCPTKRTLNVVKIDLSRYICFSSGFIPRKTEIDIHFCEECYSKIRLGELVFSTDGSFNELMIKYEKIKSDLEKTEREFSFYKNKVKKALLSGGFEVEEDVR